MKNPMLSLELNNLTEPSRKAIERFIAEINFASEIVDKLGSETHQHDVLISEAISLIKARISKSTDTCSLCDAVDAAEVLLKPIGDIAKGYKIHCVAHAHIDMNWMWGWPETVATVNDTFSTVCKLMDEFPQFKFSQSQTSVYKIMKDYLPELWAKVARLIREGRWEVTASQWVEGDKNLASGEILCRHLLYTRRFFERELGVAYDNVKIDWEPDTFGHSHTLPTILNAGGVSRYYLHRSAHGPKLFWWKGKDDSSRVLVFDDCSRGYNGVIGEHITNGLLEFCSGTGMKDYLFVYGVGDHGGGPTRRDIARAIEMSAWPIYPTVLLSTTDAFFEAAERTAVGLPVVNTELNAVFEGCYTAQSIIKLINRKSEIALIEAETASLLGKVLAGVPYPSKEFALGWEHAMFNQFHDILPGSGVRDTYTYSHGLFQQILATTSMAKTRAWRAIADHIDTQSAGFPMSGVSSETSLGAGQGDNSKMGSVSNWCPDGAKSDAFVVFNPSFWTRSQVMRVKLWDKDISGREISVIGPDGSATPCQIIGNGGFWGHSFTEVAFPAAEVPALGYSAYVVTASDSAHLQPKSGCFSDGKGTIENEFLSVTVEQTSGAITRLVDKRTGANLIKPGGRLGLLEYSLEAPHAMNSWILGQVVHRESLTSGATIECPVDGPYLARVISRQRHGESTFTTTISLSSTSPKVDFEFECDWYDRGKPDRGVPTLSVKFETDIDGGGTALFECPNGHVIRSTNSNDSISHTTRPSNCYNPTKVGLDLSPREVPSQKWVDLSGHCLSTGIACGLTLTNDCKYGFEVTDGTIKMSLLRSSYDPDPVTEQGHHSVRFSLHPHCAVWTVSDATRVGYEDNMPMTAVATGIHPGKLPAKAGYFESLDSNIMISTLKACEDSDDDGNGNFGETGIVLRVYEMQGHSTKARIKLNEVLMPSTAHVVEVDVLEKPVPKTSSESGASECHISDGVLVIEVGAYEMKTVLIK